MKLDKGAEEVLKGLLSDDPEQLREAVEFQRETFHARFGCYPEELIEVPEEETDVDV